LDPLDLSLAVLVPALAAGALLALAWKPWRREEAPDGRWSSAPALALGFLVGALLVGGAPVLPGLGGDREPASLDWLFLLVLVAGLAFPFQERLGRWRDFARGGFAVLAIELVLRNQVQRWEGLAGVGWIVGLTALYVLVWACLVHLAERRSGASMPLVAWLTVAALSTVAALTGSARIGQLGGGLAAGLGAAVVLAWWRPRLSLGRGAAGVVTLVLFGLGANAHFYSYTAALDVLLVAAAPACALLAELGPLRSRSDRGRTALALGLAALPIAVALVRVVLAYEPDPYADYY